MLSNLLRKNIALQLFGFIVLFSGQALAQSGFFAGLETGLIMGNTSSSIEVINNPIYTGRSSYTMAGRSLMGGGFAGWGRYVGKVYLGVQGGLSYQKMKADFNSSELPLQGRYAHLTLRQSFDLSGRVGFEPLPGGLLYLRLGATWGRWVGTITNNTTANGSKTTFRPGVICGIGFEGLFAPKTPDMKGGSWMWGGEFTYAAFSDLSVQMTNLAGVITRMKATPRTAALTIHIKRAF